MSKKSDSSVCINQVITLGFTFIIASILGVKIYNIRMTKETEKVETIEKQEMICEIVENNEEDYVRVVNNDYLDKKEIVVSRGANPIRTTTSENVEENALKEENNNVEDEKIEEKSVEKIEEKNVTDEAKEINKNENVEDVEKSEEDLIPPTEYKEVFDVKATAYCLCKKCCGKSEDSDEYGVTASGLKIIPHTGMKVIAVDPKVISLGSKVYVEGLNGVPDYGYAIAADTGGVIKDMKIDLYMDSHTDTDNWGIKNMRVYVLEK